MCFDCVKVVHFWLWKIISVPNYTCQTFMRRQSTKTAANYCTRNTYLYNRIPHVSLTDMLYIQSIIPKISCLGLSNPWGFWTSKPAHLACLYPFPPSTRWDTIIRENCQSCVGPRQPHQNWYSSFSPEQKRWKLWTSS
jgi:hypothetical protein